MSEQGSKFKEILTGVVVSIASIAAGTAIGWSSPVNPKLKDVTLADTPLDRVANSSELSWIGSLVALGAFISKDFFLHRDQLELENTKKFQLLS